MSECLVMSSETKVTLDVEDPEHKVEVKETNCSSWETEQGDESVGVQDRQLVGQVFMATLRIVHLNPVLVGQQV